MDNDEFEKLLRDMNVSDDEFTRLLESGKLTQEQIDVALVNASPEMREAARALLEMTESLNEHELQEHRNRINLEIERRRRSGQWDRD